MLWAQDLYIHAILKTRYINLSGVRKNIFIKTDVNKINCIIIAIGGLRWDILEKKTKKLISNDLIFYFTINYYNYET
jgi:hypothetical protein